MPSPVDQFNKLFPANTPPADSGAMPPQGGETTPGQAGGAPGGINPAAVELIRSVCQFAKQQGIPPEKLVEVIMQAVVEAAKEQGGQPPNQQDVLQLVKQFYGEEGGQAGSPPQGAPTQAPATQPPM